MRKLINSFKLLEKSADVCFPVSAPVTLSSSTLWSEFMEKKLCSKQNVGYLKDLKFCFDAMLPSHGANFSLQAKNLAGIRLQTSCNKKMLLSTSTLLFNQKKRPKSSKSSICFQFQLLFNVFIFYFMYSFKSMRFCQCLGSASFTGESVVLRSASGSLFLFWTDTVSVTFYLLDYFTFDRVLWDFVHKNTGLAAFLNQGFGVGEDLHCLLQPSFIDHLPDDMISVSF